MAGIAIETYGQPLTFSGLEGPLVELKGWSFAEILSLSHIEGTPCQIGDLQFIELRNSIGDRATLIQSFEPGIAELVHTRKLKPWAKPQNPRIREAIKDAIAAYPGVFVFEVEETNEGMGQINISSLIDLARYPLPISVEILRRRWELAARVYRTNLAEVVTPFRHISQR